MKTVDFGPEGDWLGFDGFDAIKDLGGGLMALAIVGAVACLVGGAILLVWARFSKTKPKDLVHPRVITALYAALVITPISGMAAWGIERMPTMSVDVSGETKPLLDMPQGTLPGGLTPAEPTLPGGLTPADPELPGGLTPAKPELPGGLTPTPSPTFGPPAPSPKPTFGPPGPSPTFGPPGPSS